MPKHKQFVRMTGADLARMLGTSAQQVSRWKADGILSFDDDGMADALAATRAVHAWAGHGRTPKATMELRGQSGGRGGYWDGMRAGLVLMHRLVEFYREQSTQRTPPASIERYYREGPLSDAEFSALLAGSPMDSDLMDRELKRSDATMTKFVQEIGGGIGSGIDNLGG